MDHCIDAIHTFWFRELDVNGLPVENLNSLWFSRNNAVDEQVTRQFGPWLRRGIAGELDHWAEGDRGLIALVVLLDQFSRNIHRDSAAAFAADPAALRLSLRAIDSGRHCRLPIIHRVFLYLPLEHCEDLAVQEQCVTLFAQLSRAANANHMVQSFQRYALAHRDVIARFGRFPHRNQVLARDSSDEEIAYLETHGGF